MKTLSKKVTIQNSKYYWEGYEIKSLGIHTMIRIKEEAQPLEHMNKHYKHETKKFIEFERGLVLKRDHWTDGRNGIFELNKMMGA